MSKFKHTSGPWKVDDSEFPAIGCVVDINDEQICQVSERREFAGNPMAQTEIRNNNAVLIASAPEMLDALIESTIYVKVQRDFMNYIRDIEKYENNIRIIEKATGMTIDDVLKAYENKK